MKVVKTVETKKGRVAEDLVRSGLDLERGIP